ncbi:MAG TPA: hypothetical protein VGM84_03915 [Steroidobacteraceae bacterium]|jgi:hypothetical protein
MRESHAVGGQPIAPLIPRRRNPQKFPSHAPKARTTTIGMVFRSPFPGAALHSLTATVDYYKISLSDTIGVIDSVTVYQNCFNYNGVSNPSYDPNNSFCQLIGRQTTNGGRAYTTALYSNLGTLDERAGLHSQLAVVAG